MKLVNQICNTLSLNSHRYFNNEILTQSTQSRNNNKLIKTKTKKKSRERVRNDSGSKKYANIIRLKMT